MFEKEAREYALEWGEKTDGTYACFRDGFIAGAEFGYNKGKNEAKEIIKKLLEAIDDLQIIGTWYDTADTLIEAKQFIKE